MYLVEVRELASEVSHQEASVTASHQHHLVPGQLREVVQGGEGGLVTILHILVTNTTKQTPDIVISRTCGAAIVDIQDAVSKLAEEHGECFEYRHVHPMRASMGEHN